ncbi:MAG: hypothetical protein K2O40_00835 [Lachnospiraceae bacterium]|nr:hypothetical protein [Lachnospiraceae bacterium]
MEDTKIQWHAAFVSAMNLELSQNRSDLEYHKEYNLNTKPLEVDLLVIKKDAGIEITNEIGKLFRGHNIVEYKSPDDHLNIDSFYKAGAYASLYKAYGKTVDERSAEDITVSLIRERKPTGLFAYFKEHGIMFTNPYKGIYQVTNTVLFPTQIIVTKELNPREHVWLKALSGEMEKQQMRELLEKIEKLDLKFDRELADSVLQVSVSANKQVVKELRGDENMCQALLEIMEPEINKIKAEVTKEVTKEVTREVTKEVTREVTREVTKEVTRQGINNTILALRECGQTEDIIKQIISKAYHISFQETENYL